MRRAPRRRPASTTSASGKHSRITCPIPRRTSAWSSTIRTSRASPCPTGSLATTRVPPRRRSDVDRAAMSSRDPTHHVQAEVRDVVLRLPKPAAVVLDLDLTERIGAKTDGDLGGPRASRRSRAFADHRVRGLQHHRRRASASPSIDHVAGSCQRSRSSATKSSIGGSGGRAPRQVDEHAADLVESARIAASTADRDAAAPAGRPRSARASDSSSRTAPSPCVSPSWIRIAPGALFEHAGLHRLVDGVWRASARTEALVALMPVAIPSVGAVRSSSFIGRRTRLDPLAGRRWARPEPC